MAKEKLSEGEIKDRIAEKGAILARVTFELVGKPKEHVDKTLKEYVANLEKDERLHVTDKLIGKAEKQEGGFFAAFTELEILFNSLDMLTFVCINFMPASVEVLEPSELRLSGREFGNWTNDLLAKLHEVSMAVAKMKNNTSAMGANITALIKNIVITSLTFAPHTGPALAQRAGVPMESMKPYLDSLVEEKKIARDGDSYKLVDPKKLAAKEKKKSKK